MVIFKYTLEKYKTCSIKVPSDYQVLKVALQNEQPVIWLTINNEASVTFDLNVYCIMTGERFDWSDFSEPNVDYIDSYQLNHLVCHIFCAKRKYLL